MTPESSIFSRGAGRRTRLLIAGLIVGLTLAVAGGLSAKPALAFNYHEYCREQMVYAEGCPPDGSSTWEHLEENLGQGYSGGSVCVDAYLDPNNNGYFTSQMCASYIGQPYGTVWGYPRVWNASSFQTVVGIEYYP
jgi:hypothetical protein